jgi:hypothetical protein
LREICAQAPNISPQGLFISLAASGSTKWKIQALSFYSNYKPPTAIDLIQALLTSRFHHIQAILLNLISSKIYGKLSDTKPWNKASKVHMAHDLCDWATYQVIEKNTANKLSAPLRDSDNSNSEALTLLQNHRDFRAKVVSFSKYKTHDV